jgi:hypothetical protein
MAADHGEIVQGVGSRRMGNRRNITFGCKSSVTFEVEYNPGYGVACFDEIRYKIGTM